MYFLFLDDIRVPNEVALYTPALRDLYRNNPWLKVRNFNEFVEIIKVHGVPKVVSFDHDLADEHYRPSMMNPDEHYSKYYTDGTFKEKTGYDCAKFLKEYCQEHGKPYPEIYCHSMNPVGKKNIMNLFFGS